ncbi:MAG: hypothetical protein M5U26_00220 [Planctomycetota bacterium]|nr:hypothetical protein [Planctomycetota bacterium]
MFTAKQYVAAMRHEGAVCQHLFTKIPEGCWEYRPTPGQRSMLELLRFLPHNLGTIPETVVSGDWPGIGAKMGKTKEMPPEAFPAEIDAQGERLEKLIAGIPEADYQGRGVTLPNGMNLPLGEALMMFGLKFLTAYKMQFFLYIKANGVSNIGTSNCWMGRDPAPKK